MIVETHRTRGRVSVALTAAGIPVVYTGDSDIFASDAADDWLSLLKAFD